MWGGKRNNFNVKKLKMSRDMEDIQVEYQVGHDCLGKHLPKKCKENGQRH